MRTSFILFVALCLVTISCKVSDNSLPENITGDYEGIRINSYWIDSLQKFGRDTSDVMVTVVKLDTGSFVNVSFTPSSNEDFTFEYRRGQYIPGNYFHAPILKLKNDCLYFKYQGSIGPYWTECFGKKATTGN